MSTASRARTIKYVRRIGTITGELVSNQGKLWQRYTGDGTGGDWGDIYPEWYVLASGHQSPIIEIVFTGSVLNTDTGTNELAINRTSSHPIKLKIGGTVFEFVGNEYPDVAAGYSDGNVNGQHPYFRMLKPTNSNGINTHGHHALMICDNIVKYCNGQSIPYTISCNVHYNGADVDVEISDKIDISRSAAQEAILNIVAVNGTDFVLDDNNQVEMLPMLHVGPTDVTTSKTGGSYDYIYDWAIMDPNAPDGWAPLPNGTGKTGVETVNVGKSQVGTYGYVRCEAKKGGSVVASAIQPIIDTTDGLYIEPNPVPEDETIEEGNPDRSQVVYTPQLYKIKSDGTTQQITPMLFRFMITSPAGTPLNTQGTGTQYQGFTDARASYAGTFDMCRQAGGDLSVIIVAND